MIVYLPRVLQNYFQTIMEVIESKRKNRRLFFAYQTIGFARSIYDRLRDEYKEVISITQTSLPPKVLNYCRALFTDEFYQQLISVTNQIERKLRKCGNLGFK